MVNVNNFGEYSTEKLIETLKAYAEAMDIFSGDRSPSCELLWAAAERLGDLLEEVDYCASSDIKIFKWLHKNVPDVGRAVDEMGFTETERAGIDVIVDFQNFIENEGGLDE